MLTSSCDSQYGSEDWGARIEGRAKHSSPRRSPVFWHKRSNSLKNV